MIRLLATLAMVRRQLALARICSALPEVFSTICQPVPTSLGTWASRLTFVASSRSSTTTSGMALRGPQVADVGPGLAQQGRERGQEGEQGLARRQAADVAAALGNPVVGVLQLVLGPVEF